MRIGPIFHNLPGGCLRNKFWKPFLFPGGSNETITLAKFELLATIRELRPHLSNDKTMAQIDIISIATDG